jgi:hypothetical protein
MVVSWVVMPCGLVDRYEPLEEHSDSVFRAEDGSIIFLHLQVHISQTIRLPSRSSLPQKPCISYCKIQMNTEILIEQPDS